MSDAQIAELYERLVAGRSKSVRPDRVFLRGWNAALAYAMREMKKACDEPVEGAES